jgi:hypothetical protein
MSEAPFPGSAGGEGGPLDRPHGEGLPPKTGGMTPDLGTGDSRDPGLAGDGDIGPDTGGMIDDGDDGGDE